MYTVYQHWDPLKVCTVGRAYPPEFYSWIKHTPTRNKFEKLAEETEEDFQQLIVLLQSLQIQVIRPELPENLQECWVNGEAVSPPVAPRDHFINIHNRLWIPSLPNENYARRAFSKQDIMSWEQFKQHDLDKHNVKLSFYQNIFKQVDKKGTPLSYTECDYISGCFVSRVGDNLFFATQSVHDDWDAILKNVNSLFPDTHNHVVDAQGHGDAVYCPVTPGLIISIADEDYTTTFPGWEVVHLPHSNYAKHKQFQNSMKINAGRWYIPGFEKNPKLIETVENYFNHWVGDASETVFGVNILCLDERRIVVSEHNDILEKTCARYGITVHVVPFRHKYFWDAGIHCLTNDLHRQGKMKNFFKMPKNLQTG